MSMIRFLRTIKYNLLDITIAGLPHQRKLKHLQEIISLWVTVRGYSMAASWMEV